MAVEPPDRRRQPGPIRFGMRRLMLFVTAVCVTLGTGLWWIFGPGLAVLVVYIAMQLPLMLLVRRKLANDDVDGNQDSDS